MNEPQYDDQGAPAQDAPDADSAGDPEAPDSETPDLSAAAPGRVEHTGNPIVDSVLDSLEELDRLPPAEHVAVFEAAHERLRGALSDAGEPPAES